MHMKHPSRNRDGCFWQTVIIRGLEAVGIVGVGSTVELDIVGDAVTVGVEWAGIPVVAHVVAHSIGTVVGDFIHAVIGITAGISVVHVAVVRVAVHAVVDVINAAVISSVIGAVVGAIRDVAVGLVVCGTWGARLARACAGHIGVAWPVVGIRDPRLAIRDGIDTCVGVSGPLISVNLCAERGGPKPTRVGVGV